MDFPLRMGQSFNGVSLFLLPAPPWCAYVSCVSLLGLLSQIPTSVVAPNPEIRSLSVLEAGNPKSKHRQGRAPPETLGRILHCLDLSQLLVVTSNPWCPLACRNTTPVPVSIFLGPSSLSVRPPPCFPLFKRTLVIGLVGGHPNNCKDPVSK